MGAAHVINLVEGGEIGACLTNYEDKRMPEPLFGLWSSIGPRLDLDWSYRGGPLRGGYRMTLRICG